MIFADKPIWQKRFPDIPISEPEEAEVWLVENEPIVTGPKVKWVQFMGTGLDGVLEESDIPEDVIVTDASGVAAIPVAEYVITTMLTFTRRLPDLAWAQDEYRWDHNFISDELDGKTVAILGYGSIGREVARLCHAFGMHILVCKKTPGFAGDLGWCVRGHGDITGTIPERIVGPLDLQEIVSKADFFVICAPLTRTTRNLVNWNILTVMKSSAYLINVGRGEIVDEPSLVYFLDEGRIAGAALDVFMQEPLPPDSPLWEMGSVIISPHCSGTTSRGAERLGDLFCDNLERYLRKAYTMMWNIVDR